MRVGDYALSKSRAIKLGVPQDIILGPIIFIIYINDLDGVIENVLRASLLKYADDTNILIRANTFPDMRHGIESVMEN